MTSNSVDVAFGWDPTESVATRPLWMQRVSGSYNFFYFHDGNKNVSDLVSYQSARGVPAHYEYAPFGAVTATTTNTAFTAFNVAESNPFRFSSEYTDDALGLVYYNYRHYIPSISRWTVRDPKNETFALSLFVFVNPRTAAEIGDWIPGPGEPDHAFNHGNDVPNYQQTGNPSGAWGYGPSTK